MEHRHLGRSGMLVSEISYGNWITHGAQVEADAAKACVFAALECGITTFDTADVYAGTRAEVVLGEALVEAKVKRQRIELATKVFFPTGPGKNDRGLSRKHIIESCHGSLRRLQTDYLDLYQAHRYDYFTPLEETMGAFADLTRQGKIHYVGVSEWNAQQIRDAAALAKAMGVEFVSSQPQYNLLWRVIEAEVVPACEEVGVGQIVWSPIAQGVLTGKYLPGQPVPEGSRATDEKGNGANFVARFLSDDVLIPVQRAVGLIRVTQSKRFLGHHWRHPPRASARKRWCIRPQAGRCSRRRRRSRVGRRRHHRSPAYAKPIRTPIARTTQRPTQSSMEATTTLVCLIQPLTQCPRANFGYLHHHDEHPGHQSAGHQTILARSFGFLCLCFGMLGNNRHDVGSWFQRGGQSHLGRDV
jgi:aryl-alcohol dehydrogenase-like predicted oxidoreductase